MMNNWLIVISQPKHNKKCALKLKIIPEKIAITAPKERTK